MLRAQMDISKVMDLNGNDVQNIAFAWASILVGHDS